MNFGVVLSEDTGVMAQQQSQIGSLTAGLRVKSMLQPATCGVEEAMKTKIMLGTLLVVLGIAFEASNSFDGPDPICIPGRPCAAGK